MGESQSIAAGAARSAFSGNAQHNRLMRLDFPLKDGPPAILLPNKLVAHEEVSRGFHIEVEVLSDEARIPLKMLMGRKVTISLVREDGSLRYFNGHITEFRFLRTDGGFAFYQMVLEPWLAFARLRKNSVSFHNKSVRELTEEILTHYRQADWHMYAVDESKLTVANQYNETDYNHLHRRWEAAGLHYWYEHEFGGHKLMISDNSFLAQPIDEEAYVISFHDKGGAREDDGIHEWTAIRRLGSGQTTLATFDYKNPGARCAEAWSANEQGDFFPYEVYEDTGSYGFRLPSDGEQLAARRMEEADKDTQYFEAAGNERSVLPGRTFKLGGHFSAEQRSREYDPEPRGVTGQVRMIDQTNKNARLEKAASKQFFGDALDRRASAPRALPEVVSTANKMDKPSALILKETFGLRVCVAMLNACEFNQARRQWRYREIYIHSKLLLVDDGFFTLGSANLNQRSMAADSEINLATNDARHATELRTRIWSQLTGGQHDGGNATPQEIKETFKNWVNLMKKNKKRQKSPSTDPVDKQMEGFIVPLDDRRSSTMRLG